MKFILGFLTAIILGVIIFLFIVYTGVISVKATDEEPGFIRWALETTMENSVKREADKIIKPNDLNKPERTEKGFKYYKVMCEVCHGAPGINQTELARGLNPKAPEMIKAAAYWTEEEIFLITKYGIKMTGMPAWGDTHSDDELWSITAFVKLMPEMTAEDYKSLSKNEPTVTSENHRH